MQRNTILSWGDAAKKADILKIIQEVENKE